MTVLSTIASIFTGGASDGAESLGTGIVKAIEDYFPPNMTPAEKASIQLAADNFGLQKQIQLAALTTAAEKEVDDRIAMYEGSASDLKAVPILGPLMLFLRGAQRPVWGFATIYIDYAVFSGLWKLTDPTVQNAFWILNTLVLGFLFGERAVTNIMPYVTNMVAVKNTTAPQDVSVTTIRK